MKKRILAYLSYVDGIIAKEKKDKNQNLDLVIERHLVQIAFFAHERFIHLVLTVLFALGTLLSIFTFLATGQVSILALIVMLLVLLVPYVMHYYLLENGVQKMYTQYDELLKLQYEKDGKKLELEKGKYEVFTVEG